MPVKIANQSPTAAILREEGVDIILEGQAARQDIRPMRILLLNLMPTKVTTEVQIARLLSHTPLQVELSLLTTATYQGTTTASAHLTSFYSTLEQIEDERFDGLIVTGAPVERMAFEEVAYWNELCRIFKWAKSHVFRRFHICWGAQAALYAEYGIRKYPCPEKLFGVYTQCVVNPREALLRGFPDSFPTPVSRFTGIVRDDVVAEPDLKILAESEETGICMVQNTRGDVYMMNHVEYDTDTLKYEFARDIDREASVRLPKRYFAGDDPRQHPQNTWRPFGYLLFSNWIYYLYEDTPYDLADLAGAGAEGRPLLEAG